MHVHRLRIVLSIAVAAMTAIGCATEAPEDNLDTGGGKADQISGRDDPSGLLANAERRLGALVSDADVGQTFGVDDDKVPYPDTYWPMVDDGIAVEWLEKSGERCDTPNECDDPQPSPLAKYMSITNPTELDAAVDWEVKFSGSKVPNVADWFGHCPGWAASATLNAPLQGPLFATGNGFGGVRRCEPDEAGCVKFEIGDINALQAEAYNNAVSRFIGSRCDTEPAEIERDEFGRIVRKGRGCQGLNAGSMLIVMGNVMKLQKRAFIIDAQNEFNTEQIWNQPAYRYTVHRFEHLTEAEAANLVATGNRTGDHDSYQWNSNAKGFAFVDVELHWVTETGPNLTLVSGLESTKTTRMAAVIELDRDPSDPDAVIVGGEYLDDPNVGANRLRVAPFVWMAIDVGNDFSGHNPFVKGQLVKDLIALALAPAGESGECVHPLCSEGAALDASCDPCVATVCAADGFCCDGGWDLQCVSQAASMCDLTCN